jgi:creatinine amidohydrolase
MNYADLNWMQIEAYLAEDNRLILVVGATEQHGYLSVMADVLIPQALAAAASEQTGVLAAPPLAFGSSPYFLAYPGTLSLRLSTLLAVLEDLLRSAYQQGFRKFLVLNGHGGNRGAKAVLDELANQLPGLQAFWYDWWISPRVLEIASKHGLSPSHANWLEAFPFTIVTDLPQGEKPFPGPAASFEASKVRQNFGDGSFGGHYQAPEAVMDEIFTACLQEVVELLGKLGG